MRVEASTNEKDLALVPPEEGNDLLRAVREFEAGNKVQERSQEWYVSEAVKTSCVY